MSDRQVAIVTGGSRGIGRAISLELADSGRRVAIIYKSNKEKALATLEEIENLGGEGEIFQADVTRWADVDEVVKGVLTKWGRIDILINNAGITRDKLLLKMDEEDWDEVLDIDLKGAFICTRLIARHMIKNKEGRIVNITSVIGEIGNIGQSNYSAAKAGLIGFTKACAKELSRWNITVNAVAPGYIDTEMTKVLDENVKKEYLSRIPLGRFGKAEEVAKLVLFLVSKDASYITGQVINIDGGLVI
ncbi:MAG: 3-oxoacyl-[acyl-carrier-protein] reductase [bacterium]|nr:3-oxoacyl-[acyl-carrier-protein] reductase [bacterium]